MNSSQANRLASDLTWQHLSYRILGLAIPVSLSMMINIIVSIATMIMAARLGQSVLAAGAIAVITYVTIRVSCLTSFYSVGILIGNVIGKNRRHRIKYIVRNGLVLALLMGIIVGSILWWAGDFLLLVGQKEVLVRLAIPYFHFAACGLPAVLIITVFSQFFVGIGKPRYNVILIAIMAPLTLGLAYLLIFGLWGLPQLALAGISAAGTVVSYAACIGLFLFIQCHPHYRQYDIFRRGDYINSNYIGMLLRNGLPIGVQFGGELAAVTVATYFMGWFGESALSASQIISQCGTVVVMIAIGLSQATGVLVSEYFGRDDMVTVKRVAKIALYLGVGAVFIMMTLYLTNVKWIIGLYLNIHDAKNADAIHLAIILFYIGAIVQFFDSVRNILAGALRGLLDAKTPMLIGTACLWLLSLPVAYIVAFNMGYGPIGLRAGFSIGIIICAIILYQRFFKRLA